MHSFKKACVSTAALVLAVALLFVLITAPYFGGKYYYYQDAADREALAGTIDTLIVGASYANWGVVPSILDEGLGCHSYNLGGCLQTMEGRYYLLEKELARNPVKTVVMTVSPYALTRNRAEEGPEGDLYLFGQLDNAPERFSFFLTHFAPSEYLSVLRDTMDRGRYAWGQLLGGGSPAVDSDARGFHGYPSLEQSVYKSFVEGLGEPEPLPQELNATEVYYFEKCMDLCRDSQVRVVLVCTPMTSRSLLLYSGFEEVMAHFQDYAEEYDCTFLDFNLYRGRYWDLPDFDSYTDLNHLSAVGAERFSAILAEYLRRDAAGEDVSERFFPSYANAQWEAREYAY